MIRNFKHIGNTMLMHNPPHPGEIIKGRAGISPEMAVRLSIAFDTSAESWLNQQSQYELWHAEQVRR